MEHSIIEGFLLAFLVFTEIRNYSERKNLLDRIMSRDFPEFVQYETERKKANVGTPKAKSKSFQILE